jgi:hypothetical protein
MTFAPRARRALALLFAVAWLGTAAAQGAAMRVLSSNGVRAVERSLGLAVTIDYGTSASIRQRVGAGEAVDLVFATTEVVGELAAAGQLTADSETRLGRSGIGVGIRAGSRPPRNP